MILSYEDAPIRTTKRYSFYPSDRGHRNAEPIGKYPSGFSVFIACLFLCFVTELKRSIIQWGTTCFFGDFVQAPTETTALRKYLIQIYCQYLEAVFFSVFSGKNKVTIWGAV